MNPGVPAERMTLRQCSDHFGIRMHRLSYALTYAKIEPVQRAGAIRLFDPQQIPLMKAALDDIANRGNGRKATTTNGRA